MPEQATTGATPDAAGATPAAGQGDDQQGEPTTETGQAPATGAPEVGEAGQRAIDREREARRTAERERNELRARIKAIEEKDLPEAERVSRRLTEYEERNRELEQRLRDTSLRSAVVGTASRLGFADPDDAVRLVDRTSLEFDDAGEPKDVEKALKALLAAKPYLASTAVRPSGSADAGNAGTSATDGTIDMNALIRRDAGRA
jgi:uncharacterized protein (DUF885 family)